MADPAVRQKLEEAAFSPGVTNPKEFAVRVKTAYAMWRKVITDAGDRRWKALD